MASHSFFGFGGTTVTGVDLLMPLPFLGGGPLLGAGASFLPLETMVNAYCFVTSRLTIGPIFFLIPNVLSLDQQSLAKTSLCAHERI